ncbi:MAG: glucose-6-phosphate dehydrogenase [Acidobacteriota bacterium]
MVIFGASGDLTKRKLIPALYYLEKAGLLPKEFAVVGTASTDLQGEAFRLKLERDLPEFLEEPIDLDIWHRLAERIYYIAGNFDDPATYDRIKQLLLDCETKHKTAGNAIFYLAVPPTLFGTIVSRLGEAGMVKMDDHAFRRVVIEKPFGHDLDSAKVLDKLLRATLDERQIFRIDHYLGKETVQNILVFRFANGIFEPIWNRRYVDHVQITVAESVGVELRGGYYEGAGALRDMVANHIFQLMALVAMEPPISFAGEAVRDEKAKLLNAVQPIDPEDVLQRTVRGQYGEGTLELHGAPTLVPAYRAEPQVAADSKTETFAALKVLIDNWRWAGVPFYLRTGKRLKHRVSEIAIRFRAAPLSLFRRTEVEALHNNLLVIHVQPDEGISLRFGAKVPGPTLELGAVDMSFDYADYFGTTPSTGYETLLYECMKGDSTLFQRADAVEAGWRVLQPVLDVWAALPTRGFPNYAAGTWGPAEADELMARDGRRWRNVEPVKK